MPRPDEPIAFALTRTEDGCVFRAAHGHGDVDWPDHWTGQRVGSALWLDPRPTAVAVWGGTALFQEVHSMLRVIVDARGTGMLEVCSESATRRLWFQDGCLSGATSTATSDRLGEVLWQAGRLGLEQVLAAVASRRPGKRLGRTLVELGFLTSAELRPALRAQTQAVLESAGTDGVRSMLWRAEEKAPNPVLFARDETQAAIDEVQGARARVNALRARLAPLDVPCVVSMPPPARVLPAAAQAMLQLATSANPPLTRRALLERTSLRPRPGCEALRVLVEHGFFRPPGPEPSLSSSAADGPDANVSPVVTQGAVGALPSDIARLVRTLARWVSSLQAHGFGLTEPLTDVLARANPGGGQFTLAELTDEAAVAASIRSRTVDVITMRTTLQALIDLALFEARDALADEDFDALRDAAALDR